ncbi:MULTISPECIES: TetR/AcrR family transcriptional regulator [Cellulomonas]|uniref:Regulatory protein TetR n=1 Tax=Cellulomonas gilvus (strain ATCC 13127 / NRRL B-14078) TaxID=593907 RepID=F8A0H5_CELGA|nr:MULTISPECIES: TetR/AcrR family transcriptional regulator [Cellulomonas]AEI11519.1 regulatory protein TetR [Cellulomonas gilvus ATCC 13127]MCR6690624.1 TetR/AcrR family transcriptional regulator [Cellulomonas sp.]
MTSPASTPRGPLRRDAERNRERIVAAARELFADQGLGVGFNEIARHAGVGVGTVYRRFADKHELLETAFAEPLRDVLAVADEASRAEPAWDGLVQLLTRVTELLVENIGLRDLALGGYDDLGPVVDDSIGRITDELLQRARAEGDLRADARGSDVLVLLWLVTELATHTVDVQPEAYRRYLHLLLEGLRARPADAALEPPLTDAQALEVSRRWADHSSRARPRTT